MDWGALRVTLALGAWTLALLLPFAVLVGRWLAVHEFQGKGLVEAALALPLVLPPTVLGYYLLVGMGSNSPLGALAEGALGRPLAFSFEGLVLASLVATCPSPSSRSSAASRPCRPRCATPLPAAAWGCSGRSGAWRCRWRGRASSPGRR